MKVAIVHDWLVTFGGAELFVEYLLKIFPDADIFTSVHDKKRLGDHFTHNRIFTSKLQSVPFASHLYRKCLKWLPDLFESFDLSSYDLVISSSSCCAKGVITSPLTPHVAFIHSPMRYAWDLFFDYKKRSGRLTRFFMDRWMHDIRLWDYVSSQRIDVIISNSNYIARRIKKFWNRDARTIYLPVDTSRFSSSNSEGCDVPAGEYYVAFSRLVPYKRIDLAVSACLRLQKRLVVIGLGPEFKKIKKLAAKSPLVSFVGRASNEQLSAILHNARALLFCAEEDYGFVPLEAQSCGCPVIAFGKGGACETVVDKKTGIFFGEQTTQSLCDAINTFENMEFSKSEIVAHAKSFTFERFQKEFLAAVEDAKQIARAK